MILESWGERDRKINEFLWYFIIITRFKRVPKWFPSATWCTYLRWFSLLNASLVLFLFRCVTPTLQLRMFHTVSPIILYRHCLEWIQEGIVVKTIKFIWVILKIEKWNILLNCFCKKSMSRKTQDVKFKKFDQWCLKFNQSWNLSCKKL